MWIHTHIGHMWFVFCWMVVDRSENVVFLFVGQRRRALKRLTHAQNDRYMWKFRVDGRTDTCSYSFFPISLSLKTQKVFSILFFWGYELVVVEWSAFIHSSPSLSLIRHVQVSIRHGVITVSKIKKRVCLLTIYSSSSSCMCVLWCQSGESLFSFSFCRPFWRKTDNL